MNEIPNKVKFLQWKSKNSKKSFCSQVDENTVYFVEYREGNQFFKYDIPSGETTVYESQHFLNSMFVNYNKDLNRVYITIKLKGIFWFEVGKESQIFELTGISGFTLGGWLKDGLVFNQRQAVYINQNELLYTNDIGVDIQFRKLNISETYINSCVFLDNDHVAILYNSRNFEIIKISQNLQVYKQKIDIAGFGTSMCIDSEKKYLVISITQSSIGLNNKCSWAQIFYYRILRQPDTKWSILKYGDPFMLCGGACNIFDMKMSRVSQTDNLKYYIVTSSRQSQLGNRQVRLFLLDTTQQKLEEVQDLPTINNTKQLISVSILDGQFMISGSEGDLIHLKIK